MKEVTVRVEGGCGVERGMPPEGGTLSWGNGIAERHHYEHKNEICDVNAKHAI